MIDNPEYKGQWEVRHSSCLSTFNSDTGRRKSVCRAVSVRGAMRRIH
jgi:hypothetical protein